MDNVWSSLSKRVEAKLGRPLLGLPPDDPANPDFLALLHQIRQADPDLAEEVINAYTGTTERLPSEAEAAAERRRQRVHRSLFERFVRPDGLRTGRTRLNLRKTINWIAAAVALFVIIWSVAPKSARVSTPARRALSATPRAVARSSSPSAVPTIPSPAPSPALSSNPRPNTTAGPGVPLLTVSPPMFPPRVSGARSGLVPTPPPMPGLFTRTAAQVIVFEASQVQPGSTSPLPQVVVFASQDGAVSTPAPAPVVVFDASATRASVGSSVMPPAASGASAQAAADAVARGELLEATLATPVAVTSSGGATPALAEIAQGPLEGTVLVGQATRSPEGLVLIQFNMLIAKDGREQPFRAAAYDAQVGRLGVGGQVSTMMPGAASALLGATLQSVSDYFKARAQQQQVTVTNGFLAITQGTPSFWDGLASAVARAFAPSAQSTTGPTVVTRLERGQPISVLTL